MSYGKIKAFNDPALTAFMPGNGKNTILRLAANALGIPLQEEGQPAQQQQAFGGMPEWAGNLNPSSNIAPVKPPQTKPQQYAQYGGFEFEPQEPVDFDGYDDMVKRKDARMTPEQYLVFQHMLNLPPEPQRPFDKDFPNKDYKVDRETGRMETDIDGRQINPNAVIVGRAYENQGDFALSDQDAENIIKALTGENIVYTVPNGGKNVLGSYTQHFDGSGYGPIKINPILNGSKEKNIPPESMQKLKKRSIEHEFGHLIDDVGGTIDKSLYDIPDDVREELSKIYNEQKNPYLGFARLRYPESQAEDSLYWQMWSPELEGYGGENSENTGKRDDRRRELVAEALRAYMSDPNAVKTRFPKAASYLRNHVNTNPRLNKYIHFSDNTGNMKAGSYLPLVKQNKNT